MYIYQCRWAVRVHVGLIHYHVLVWDHSCTQTARDSSKIPHKMSHLETQGFRWVHDWHSCDKMSSRFSKNKIAIRFFRVRFTIIPGSLSPPPAASRQPHTSRGLWLPYCPVGALSTCRIFPQEGLCNPIWTTLTFLYKVNSECIECSSFLIGIKYNSAVCI